MDSPQNQNHVPPAEGFGTVPNAAATFGTVPQNAEAVGSVRHPAEGFRNVPSPTEARPQYTLTVREVSRKFEAAGVARSERSIVNWCKRNGQLPGKLDADYDPNERKYFITPESVDLAIAEEKAKAAKHGLDAEGFGTIPKPEQKLRVEASPETPADAGRLKALEVEVIDLKILNQGKDYFIDQLRQERDSFAEERKDYVEKLMSFNHRVGKLESQLLQLGEVESQPRKLEILRDEPTLE